MRNRVRNYRFLKRRCLLRIKCVSLFWKEEIFKNNYCLGYYLLARGSKYFLLPKNTTEYFCAFICCFSNYSDKTGQKMAFPDFLWSVVAATFPLHYAKWIGRFFLLKLFYCCTNIRHSYLNVSFESYRYVYCGPRKNDKFVFFVLVP